MAKKNAYEAELNKLLQENDTVVEDIKKDVPESTETPIKELVPEKVINNEELNENEHVDPKESQIVENVQSTSEVIVTEPQTLTDYVRMTLDKIDEEIKSQVSQNRFKKGSKKLKHSDIYCGVTWAVRRKIDELIELLVDESGLNKYEVIDMILMSGLRNINFEE
jgi:glutaredoxin 2